MYEHIVDQVCCLPETSLHDTNNAIFENQDDPADSDGHADENAEPDDTALEDTVSDNMEADQQTDLGEVLIIADDVGQLKIQMTHLQDYLQRGTALQTLSVWEYISLV